MEDKNRGKLIILEGHLDINPTRMDWEGNPWMETNILIPDAFIKADYRKTQTKENKLFCYNVGRTLSEGKDVILVTPEIDRLDKRLRKPDIHIRLGGKG